jgi:hypothetical protein
MLQSMRDMASTMSAAPGYIDAGQWVQEVGDLIAGISLWSTKVECLAALEGASRMKQIAYDEEREARPRERFNLQRIE